VNSGLRFFEVVLLGRVAQHNLKKAIFP